MLVTEQQPNPLVPAEISKKSQWRFRSTDYVVQDPQSALVGLIFTNGAGGADGQSFTFAGVDFTTDSSQPYTFESFDYSGSAESAAENFAGMLRSNAEFVDWNIWVTFAGFYIVFAQHNEIGPTAEAELEMSVALAPAVNVQRSVGVPGQYLNQRVWYQFFDNQERIGSRNVAALDGSGRVVIDGAPAIRPYLGYIYPYLLWVNPEIDELASRVITMRYGVANVDPETGDRSFGQAYETAPVVFINTVRRVKQQNGMRPFTPDYTSPVEWLDTRSRIRTLYRDQYDFTAIWIQPGGSLDNPMFRIRYEYYLSGGVQIATSESRFNGQGLWHIPIGPRNACHNPTTISSADYYTAVIEMESGAPGTFFTYSQTYRVDLVSEDCFSAQLVYLSDLGSWQTILFEYTTAKSVGQESVDWVSDVEVNREGYSPNPLQLFAEGGRQSRKQGDESLVLESYPVNDRTRYEIEQLLVSPKVFILEQTDTFPALRPIVIDPAEVQTLRREESTRVRITVRYNEKIRARW